MSTELAQLLFISVLAVMAGVCGFVIGGIFEMRKYRKEISARRMSGKNSVSLVPVRASVRGREDIAA